MTGRRPGVVAHSATAGRLERLGVARHDRPSRPASLDPAAVPILAVVAAAEHLLDLCRLARMASTEAEDPAARRLVVCAGALCSALEVDARSGGSAEVERIYEALVHYRRHREPPG